MRSLLLISTASLSTAASLGVTVREAPIRAMITVESAREGYRLPFLAAGTSRNVAVMTAPDSMRDSILSMTPSKLIVNLTSGQVTLSSREAGKWLVITVRSRDGEITASAEKLRVSAESGAIRVEGM